MTISLTCSCGRNLQAPGRLAGRKIRCPSCNSVVEVPSLKNDNDVIDRPRARSRKSFDQTTSQPRIVSNRCPECGEADFKRVKPKRWIAFSSDRKCTSCETVYTPPTPIWAAFVFILIGLVMFVVGSTFAVALILRATKNPPPPPDPLGLAFIVGTTVVGVLAMIHGIRALIRPGKV